MPDALRQAARRAALMLLAAACGGAAACAPPAPMFPTGAVTADPQAMSAWTAATASCRSARVYSAELTLSGRVADEKLHSIKVQSAMTRDGRIRMVAVAPIGGPIFVLAGRADRATLTLPRDQRVLTAPVGAIVHALIGLSLTPEDWVDVLAGCAVSGRAASAGRAGDAVVATLATDATRDAAGAASAAPRVLLRPDGALWRVRAGERADATVQYDAFLGTWPSSLRLVSRPGAAVAIDVRVAVDQIFVNTDIPERAFIADVPAAFTPMTLDQLRAIGPLGAPDAPRHAGGVD